MTSLTNGIFSSNPPGLRPFKPNWTITYHSRLNPAEHRNIYTSAEDEREAWETARNRLGSLDTVVSVKPYKEN